MKKLSPARIFRYGGVVFLIGVVSAHFWPFPISFLFLFLLFLLLIFFSLFKQREAIVICLFLFSFFLGIYRWQNVFSFWKKQSSLLQGNITLRAVIKKEPLRKKNYQKIIIPPLEIYLGRYPSYHYGDIVEVKGKAEALPSWHLEGSSFVSAKMFYPQVKLLHPASFSLPQLAIVFRSKIENSLQRVVPQPESGLLLSLMLGRKNKLSSSLKKEIRKVGLAHIIVVSGLHLSIIIEILTQSFSFLGLRKRENFPLSSLFVLIFVFMVGLTPSIIRASIMAFLLIIAQLSSRLSHPLYSLLWAAVLMVWFNPLILAKSLSFQLSFLATGGIVLLYPLINRSPFWQKEFFLNKGRWLKLTFLPSLSAFLMVAPWIAYKMQTISLVTLFTNLLVVPVLPLIIILGGVTAFFSWLFDPLGLFLGFVLQILLKYLLFIIRLFSAFPLSQIYLSSSLRWLVFPCYILLFIYIYYQRRKLEETTFLGSS